MLSMFLDKIAQHQRATPGTDDSAGTTRSWSTVNANVSVAVWPTGSREAREFLRADVVADYTIVSAVDLGAKARDRFSCAGSYYIVEVVPSPFSCAGVSTETVYVYGCSKRTV